MKNLTLALFLLALFACNPANLVSVDSDGYAPVYASIGDITKISFEPSRKTEAAGKIYAAGSYIFQSEINKGIHIINNTNRNQPKKTGFLTVPFSTEIAVKGNYLYTNNLNDLLVFDISKVDSPRLVKRVENVFPVVDQKYPPISNTSFECPDPAKGIVIRWERKMLNDPKCRR